MFRILITTADFDNDGKFEIVDHESFSSAENDTHEEVADRIYQYVMQYTDHQEVRVRYSLFHKSLNRAFMGEMLNSLRFPQQIKREIVGDLIKVANFE